MSTKSRLVILKNNLFKSGLIILFIVFGFSLNIQASLNKKGEIKKAVTINYKITVVDSSENTPLSFVVLILKKKDKFINVKETESLWNCII